MTKGRGENKLLILASLLLSLPRLRMARILEYVSRSATQAAAKRGRTKRKVIYDTSLKYTCAMIWIVHKHV